MALLGPALSACAPREYREAVEQLDSPHPDSPQIEPLAGLLAPPAATDADATRPAAAPEPSPLDPESGLIARNEALNDRAQELAARPGPNSPPPAQADLRDRADALRARQD